MLGGSLYKHTYVLITVLYVDRTWHSIADRTWRSIPTDHLCFISDFTGGILEPHFADHQGR